MNKRRLFSCLIILLFLTNISMASPTQPWNVTINGDNLLEPVIFGYNPDAGDGYDSLDMYADTPVQSKVILTLDDIFAKSIKKDSLKWNFTAGVPTGTTTSLSWDASNTPSAFELILSNGTTNINMKTQTSLVLPNGTHNFIISTKQNSVPIANDDSNSTSEDTSIDITLSASDVDGDSLTYIIVTNPTNGTVSLNGNVTTYTPKANYSGTDSFTFKANDGKSDSNVATVNITVTPVNDAPVAVDNSSTTNEDTPVSITLSASDVDGDSLTYSIVSNPTNGTVSLTGDKATYTPKANYSGTDSFTFKANDTLLDSNVATVNITVTPVNDAPVAVDNSSTTNEDTPVSITLSASDVDGDSLTYSIVTNPTNGTVSLNGKVATYTPKANYNGADSFTFKANDGEVDSNVATVHITVGGVNDAPVANDNSTTVVEDSINNIKLVATDNDSDSLTYNVTQPNNGTVSLNGDIATYIPDANYNGADSFTFKANDGKVDSNVATVHITVTPVNDAPISVGGSNSTSEDTSIDITLSASDVDGDTLTYIIVSNPTNGTVSLNGKVATYTPKANYNGADSFTFKANDTLADSNVATVNITVTPVNDAPYIDPVVTDIKTNEDTQTTYSLKANENDVDNTDSELIWSISGVNTSLFTASIDSNDLLTVTPVLNEHGSDVVTLALTDGNLTVTQNITITVTPVNDPPVLESISDVTVNETEDIVIKVNATDVDSDKLRFTGHIYNMPEPVFNNITNTFTWKTNYNTVKFGNKKIFKANIIVTDAGGLHDRQPVTVTVINKNRKPILSNINNITVSEGGYFIITPEIFEPDNDHYTINYTESPYLKRVNGLWHATKAGTYTINVNVTDSGGLSAEQNVTITVRGTPPRLFVVKPPKYIEISDKTFNVTGIVYDNDLANVTLNVSINGTLTNLTGSINNEGWFDKKISLSNGKNKLEFNATDGSLKSRTIIRIINVSSKGNERPKLTIIKPSTNNTNVTSVSNQFTIYGRVSDDSGIPPAVNVSNDTINRHIGVSKDGKFAKTVTLNGGMNHFTVTATDAVNNSLTNSSSLSVNYTHLSPQDNKPPVLVITYPSRGLVVHTDKLLVTGYARDDSGIKNITVNGTVVSHSNGVFSTVINLMEGRNTVTVNATDSSGNHITKTRTVNYSKPSDTTGVIKVEKITLAVSQNILVANSTNVTNVTAFATDLDGRPANNSENVTFVEITNSGENRTKMPVINGSATLSINATKMPQTIVLIAGNSTTDILATKQIVVKPEIKIQNRMKGLTVTAGDNLDNDSEVSMLEGGIIQIKSSPSVASELVNTSQYNDNKTTISVGIGSGAKLEIGVENPMLTDSNNITGDITDIVLNNTPIESDFSDINETVGHVTIDVDVNLSGNTIPGNLEFELSGHRTIDDSISSIGGKDANFTNATTIKQNIADKLETDYNKKDNKTYIDNAVAAVIHGKLKGASNDNISGVPVTFTLNSSWYNNTAGGNKDNVTVFEINETTGKITDLGRDEVTFNSAGDRVTIKATAKGFSSFALMAINTIPDNSASSSSSGGATTVNSGGGGGGGGGGGASGEAYENIESIEKYDKEIYRDIPTNYHFSHNGIINDINITGNVNAGLINVKVEVLHNTSTLVNKSAPGNVYKNVNIWVGGAGFAVPKNIKEATIKFGVNKNWLDENGISEIVMYRYTDDEWVKLTTKKIGEENGSVIYSVVTNHFSPYAISGFSARPNKEPVKSTGENIKPTATVTTGNSTSGQNTGGILGRINYTKTLGSLLIVALIGIVVGFELLRRRKK